MNFWVILEVWDKLVLIFKEVVLDQRVNNLKLYAFVLFSMVIVNNRLAINNVQVVEPVGIDSTITYVVADSISDTDLVNSFKMD